MANASAFSGAPAASPGMSPEGFLLPAIDAEAAPFWDGAMVGELRVQVCDSCGAFRFPPRPMCPKCRSFDRSWRAVSGRGTVWSYVVAHPPLLPAYAAVAPFNVIVVALDEDPTIRLVGNLVTGPDGTLGEIDPATITIGEPVEVVFHRTVRMRDGDDEGGVAVLPRWVRTAS